MFDVFRMASVSLYIPNNVSNDTQYPQPPISALIGLIRIWNLGDGDSQEVAEAGEEF